MNDRTPVSDIFDINETLANGQEVYLPPGRYRLTEDKLFVEVVVTKEMVDQWRKERNED